jgi:hypothetical protein
MIRYRTVSPTNGSGDIRKTLYTLLSKVINEEIELTYNNILFELSNSPSPIGRFLDDKEFKDEINSGVDLYDTTLYFNVYDVAIGIAFNKYYPKDEIKGHILAAFERKYINTINTTFNNARV